MSRTLTLLNELIRAFGADEYLYKTKQSRLKLRAKVYNSNDDNNINNKSDPKPTLNGHHSISSSLSPQSKIKAKNFELEYVKIKKELEIERVNVEAQNDEILRLQTEIEQLKHTNMD